MLANLRSQVNACKFKVTGEQLQVMPIDECLEIMSTPKYL